MTAETNETVDETTDETTTVATVLDQQTIFDGFSDLGTAFSSWEDAVAAVRRAVTEPHREAIQAGEDTITFTGGTQVVARLLERAAARWRNKKDAPLKGFSLTGLTGWGILGAAVVSAGVAFGIANKASAPKPKKKRKKRK